MKFHKTCQTLPIYNFKELVKTNDLRFLLVKFNEFDNEDLLLTKDQKRDLNNAYKDIVYEYSELTANNSIINNYKSTFIIKSSELRYNITIKILENYSEHSNVEVLLMLNKINWNFSLDKDINQQIEFITKSMRGLRTKIDLLKIKYKEKFESNDVDDDGKDISYNLDKESLLLELNLKLGYSINTKKTTVTRWVNMCNISKERISKNNKH